MPNPEQPDAFEQMKAVRVPRALYWRDGDSGEMVLVPADTPTARARYAEQDVMDLVKAARAMIESAQQIQGSRKVAFETKALLGNAAYDLGIALVPFAEVGK